MWSRRHWVISGLRTPSYPLASAHFSTKRMSDVWSEYSVKTFAPRVKGEMM